MSQFLWLVPLLASGALASVFPCGAAYADTAASVRTWKTVAELSPEERAAVDFSLETPRHAEFPYLPAEPFPFAPPYTAEEMGLRAQEFFLRPALEEEKFPGERRIELSTELRARVQAQEQADRLVFVGEDRGVPPTRATLETKATSAVETVGASDPAWEVRPEQTQASNSSNRLGSLGNQREER